MSNNNPFSWLSPEANQEDARETLEQNEKMLQDAAQQRMEVAKLFYDVFAQGRGPELLEHMRAFTIDLDLFAVSPVIGNEHREMGVGPSEWAYHRNGQNSVVRWIEQNLQFMRLLENEGTNNV